MEPRAPPANRRTRVLCVDDRPDVVAALQLVIDSDPSMVCVGCLCSADDLLEQAQGLVPKPDIVIVDATMPGQDPLRAIKHLAADLPSIRAIVYTGRDDPGLMARVRAAGAWGCVSKQAAPEELLQAVRQVATGKTAWLVQQDGMDPAP